MKVKRGKMQRRDEEEEGKRKREKETPLCMRRKRGKEYRDTN